jgi:hypothetical protein
MEKIIMKCFVPLLYNEDGVPISYVYQTIILGLLEIGWNPHLGSP